MNGTKRKIDHVHERALRIVDYYESPFDELLIKDGSVLIHHRNFQLVATVLFTAKSGLSLNVVSGIYNEKHYEGFSLCSPTD